MNAGVIGAGGVGGYFGGKLARLLKHFNEQDLNVYFVARGEHLKEIKARGLILSTVDEGEFICRPTLATDDFDILPVLDLCLICVKSFDLNNALRQLAGKIGADTAMIPLLNGVDIYERIRAVIPQGVVFPSCVYVGTHIERPGKVTQNGGSCTIFFGPDPQYPDVIPDKIFGLFDSAGIRYSWCEDPYTEIWSKYIFISAYGMVTASENKTLGQILESKELCDLVIDIMNEIAGIAKKHSINLPANIVEESFVKGKHFPFATKTSFQRDFDLKDRPDERELFGDTIIRLGQASGVMTPVTMLVNEKLKKLKASGNRV